MREPAEREMGMEEMWRWGGGPSRDVIVEFV